MSAQRPRIKVKKVAVWVYCRAGDENEVHDMLLNFLGDCGIDLYEGDVTVDGGIGRSRAEAVEWFTALDEGTQDEVMAMICAVEDDREAAKWARPTAKAVTA